ncbi:DUF1275 domain-containing protein [Wohlfahrtiimonas chitiniclastica]|nr:DUF1275 domain-containing protein [Wohlfahrtiimonas chitiniclastica]
MIIYGKGMIMTTNQHPFPVMENPGIACLLAIIAGMMNGFTYDQAGVFGTVQSGNVIMIGHSLATGNWAHLKIAALTVLAFGLGSMTTVFIQYLDSVRKKLNWTFAILLLEAAILCLLATGILTPYLSLIGICIIISFIAGMQGNGFHKMKGMLYGNIAVTMVAQLAFNHLMRFLCGTKGAFKTALLFFAVLISFALGGFCGTLLTHHFHEHSLFVPAALLVLLALYLYFSPHKKGIAIDPT